MKNDEKKAKALEDEKKIQSSENLNPEKDTDIISDDDAEKLEGGIDVLGTGDGTGGGETLTPGGGVLGGFIC